MPFSSPQTMLAVIGRRLESFAAERGIAFRPLVESVGVDPALLQLPEARISLEAFMRLLHLLEIVSGDDCVGLRYAVHFQRGDSGPFGFAILNAPTLAEALRVYHAYQRIVPDHSFFEMEEAEGEVALRWRYSRLLGYPEQYADLHAGLMMKILRSYTGGEWFPRRVQLARPRPRSPALHMAYFGPSTGFGAALNEVAFPASCLAAPSRTADPRLFEMMESACRAALDGVDRRKDLRLKVKERILAVLPMGRASLAKIAADMALGERSLQRRLAEHGTSFERLLDETRRELSDRLLTTGAPLSEISYLCGYSNASAYSRAAKGWYGVSPQRMRQSLGG